MTEDSWIEIKSNKEILQKVKPKILLEAIKMLKRKKFEYMMKTHHSLEIYVMLGNTAGARENGSLTYDGWISKVCLDSL